MQRNNLQQLRFSKPRSCRKEFQAAGTGLLCLHPAPEGEHLMGQHDRDSCCSILQLRDPCHIPDKPLKQELPLPGCCQQRNHCSDSSAIRLLGTLPKCEGDLMLSVPDQSAVTELCWCRGPQRFQIIFTSPSKPRIFICPDL